MTKVTEHSTHTQASIIFNIVHQLFSVCSKHVTMIVKDCKLGSFKIGYLLGKKKCGIHPMVHFMCLSDFKDVCVCVFFSSPINMSLHLVRGGISGSGSVRIRASYPIPVALNMTLSYTCSRFPKGLDFFPVLHVI